MNVPAAPRAHQPADISWTSAYPLIANWLHLYFGDLAVVRDHWPTLKRYVDGQERQMTATASNSSADAEGVPDFWSCGDWCAVESRAICTPNTGPPAAAANYILAVEAMHSMAEALNEGADAARYSAKLAMWRSLYDPVYFNATLSSYSKTALEVQSMNAVALGAGAVPASRVTQVTAALVADVKGRGNHLTVGATGQKWLLRTLSAVGPSEHDVALAVASQTSFPSWGYWIANGATTCWESWTGLQDASHPPNPNSWVNPPTHNHIFLCGGVGDWMYRSIGGIAPTAPGYGSVKIAPQISTTLDPASTNASVASVRGVIVSDWVRHATATSPSACNGEGWSPLVTMRTTVPVGMHGVVHIPLLGRDPLTVSIDEVTAGVMVWSEDQAAPSSMNPTATPWLRSVPRVEGGAVVMHTTAAKLEFLVRERC
jgi:alpha-L-rhamnosidase